MFKYRPTCLIGLVLSQIHLHQMSLIIYLTQVFLQFICFPKCVGSASIYDIKSKKMEFQVQKGYIQNLNLRVHQVLNSVIYLFTSHLLACMLSLSLRYCIFALKG